MVAQGDAEKKADATPKIDKVVLKDGSIVLGKIVNMVGGNLSVETVFGGSVSIKWSEVEAVHASNEKGWVITDENGKDSIVRGTTDSTEAGKVVITKSGDGIAGATTVDLSKVSAIDPPVVPAVTYSGSANLGLNITDGNTQTKSGSLALDFEAKSERQRLTAGAGHNYAEQNGEMTARNSKGRIKYDLFVTERLFVYVGTLFEEDKFQDLNLRTALSGGPGYQFVKPGDCPGGIFEKLDAYGEVGLSFFDEDFRRGMDNRYLAARWAFVASLPISDTVAFFHRHEGYPGLENLRDLYLTSEQGVRFTIWENLIATLQLNYRWDNTPSPGFERSDTQYLATLGWAFSL